MRPLFFLCALFISSFSSVYGQVGYGPEIGVGMSTMHFAPPTAPILYTSASVSSIFSGKIGGLIDVALNKHAYFQAGLNFSRKGATRDFSYYKNDSFNEQVHQTLILNYFDLPLSVVYKSGMQGKGRFIVGIGATPSYIVGGSNKLRDHQVFRDTLTNTNDNLKIAVGQTVGGFDIGVNLSAGYELPTGLFLRAYYTVGVNDIGTGTEIDKNRMWGIAAGYIFGKGRNIRKETDDLIDKSSQ